MTAGPDMAIRLQFIGVSRFFPPRKRGDDEGVLAIEGVDVTVRDGEVVSLIGPSGCGKSTLLNLASGLDRPSTGRVFVDGEEVDGPNEHVAFMLQKDLLLPWRSIRQNVEFGQEIRGRPSAERRERAMYFLSKYRLADFADHYPHELSGGMRQRAALARTMVMDPDVLLLDEPFSALDAFTRRALQADVRRIAGELGLTVILVTHDVGEAVAMADRAFVMAADPGRVVCETALGPASREPGTPAFEAERARLAALYETHAARKDAA